MNLYELEELIKSLDKKEDKDLIEFYNKKKEELIRKVSTVINNKLKKVGA